MFTLQWNQNTGGQLECCRSCSWANEDHVRVEGRRCTAAIEHDVQLLVRAAPLAIHEHTIVELDLRRHSELTRSSRLARPYSSSRLPTRCEM